MKSRYLVPELMDDPGLDANVHRQALDGLRRINRISRTASTIARKIIQYSNDLRLPTARILDLGCGCGDVAYGVAKLLPKHGDWQIEGWDISPTAIDYARQLYGDDPALASLVSRNPKISLSNDRTRSVVADASITSQSMLSFHQQDVFQAEGPPFDFVYCSLFLHHFSDSDAIRVLRRMRDLARHVLIVDDLNRSRMGYWMARIGVRLLSRSPIVHFDGPQSVRAAFSMSEVKPLARAAGLSNVTLESRWPGRWLLAAELYR